MGGSVKGRPFYVVAVVRQHGWMNSAATPEEAGSHGNIFTSGSKDPKVLGMICCEN
jgi:hypothetical protein